jgi:hypothetical protein
MKEYAAALAVMALITGSFTADADVRQTCSAMEQDTDRPGQDVRSFSLSDPDPAKCQNACSVIPACRAWTYVKPGVQGVQARCWLKDGVPSPVHNTNCIPGTCSMTAPVFPGSSAPQGQVGTGTTGSINGTPPAPYQSVPASPPTAASNTGAPGPSAPSGWPQAGR